MSLSALFRTMVVAVGIMGVCPAASSQVIGGYVHRGAAPNGTVIVFIHGLGSSAREAWTNPETKLFWPDVVHADRAFNSADIFLVDYLSSARSGESIETIADSVTRFLKINSVWEYADIVVVGHSLGGVIARRLILQNPTEGRRVKLMYLIASPSGGSRLADYGVAVGVAGETVRQLGKIAEGNFLDVLRHDWERQAPEIPVYCAVEGMITRFSMTRGRSMVLAAHVVSLKSAALLCNRKVVEHAQHDHNSISKPGSNKDSVHLAFQEAFAKR